MKASTDVVSKKGLLSVGVYKRLIKTYPGVHGTLSRKSPQQYLLVNILSPQCSDKIANDVSQRLWEQFRTLEKIASADEKEISTIIKKCGMHNVKSKHIKASAKRLVEVYGGKLPDTLGELMTFPGIGRKTALVILQEQFGKIEGIIIDTHNIRIAKKIGLTKSKNPTIVERDVQAVLPRKYWRLWSHLMVFHGREICIARKPRCDECIICDLCEYGTKEGCC